jgi:hypothetical protein
MLKARFLLASSSALILALNGFALWHVLRAEPPLSPIVGAALIVSAASWPLALALAYRIGQITGRISRHRKQPSSEGVRA